MENIDWPDENGEAYWLSIRGCDGQFWINKISDGWKSSLHYPEKIYRITVRWLYFYQKPFNKINFSCFHTNNTIFKRFLIPEKSHLLQLYSELCERFFLWVTKWKNYLTLLNIGATNFKLSGSVLMEKFMYVLIPIRSTRQRTAIDEATAAEWSHAVLGTKSSKKDALWSIVE